MSVPPVVVSGIAMLAEICSRWSHRAEHGHHLRQALQSLQGSGASDNASTQPPLFPEPPTKWLLLREDPSERRQDVAFPFLLEGAPFIPAGRPEVAGGGEVRSWSRRRA